MWKFVDKICSRCAVDLTTVEPERIRWRWLHPYSRCPNCGDVCPVIEVEPEPELPRAKGRRGAPEPEPVIEPELPAEEAPPAEPVKEVPPPEPEE